MKTTAKIAAIAGICVIAVGIIAVNAIPQGCTSMCYDPVKNWKTKGYDPQFLKQAIVLQTCHDSHIDLMKAGMKDLGFCSKELGTL